MQSLHAIHRKLRGLAGCSGLGALDLQINKSLFNVGEAPVYTIVGATPNAPVLWNSLQNGIATGEVFTDYGHRTDAAGNWSQAGGNWINANAGSWIKTVTVGNENDSVTFQVNPQTATPQVVSVPGVVTTTQLNTEVTTDTIEIFGKKIPKTAAYLSGALLVYFLLKKK